MSFFTSLTLDLKILVAAMASCVLMALFAGNKKTETRSMIVLAVLAAVGVYRITHLPANDQGQKSAATRTMPQSVPAPPKHKPLESTFAK